MTPAIQKVQKGTGNFSGLNKMCQTTDWIRLCCEGVVKAAQVQSAGETIYFSQILFPEKLNESVETNSEKAPKKRQKGAK